MAINMKIIIQIKYDILIKKTHIDVSFRTLRYAITIMTMENTITNNSRIPRCTVFVLNTCETKNAGACNVSLNRSFISLMSRGSTN
jgi:hypothetical protein